MELALNRDEVVIDQPDSLNNQIQEFNRSLDCALENLFVSAVIFNLVDLCAVHAHQVEELLNVVLLDTIDIYVVVQD